MNGKRKIISHFYQGFTLIELLIVIVIIGILAGVLISVIDPAAQQNRAKDANVKATINKIALNVSGFVSAFSKIPNEVELLGSLIGAIDPNSTCADTSQSNCTFVLGTLPLSLSCDATTTWRGIGATQCEFFYCGGDGVDDTNCIYSDSETLYRIFAKAFGSPNVHMYRSSNSSTYLCDQEASNCQVVPIGQ